MREFYTALATLLAVLAAWQAVVNAEPDGIAAGVGGAVVYALLAIAWAPRREP